MNHQHFQIYSINVNGTELKQLTNNNFNCSNPCISGDGKKILFKGYLDEYNKDIYIINIDGTDQKALLNDPNIDEFSPAWIR